MAYDEKNNVYIGYIYLVTNNITGKKYVGQTRRTIQERWADHINRRYSDDYYFHRALIKYGTDNFSIKEIDVICEADLESLVDSLNESEIYYIEYFKTLYPDGYNLTIGGGNTSVNFLKPVNQYDLCGNYIRRYNSIIEASRITGINRKGIANSCNRYISKDGKHIYTSGGFIWRFDGDTDISDAVSNIKYGRKVVKFDMYGKQLCVFDSLIEAEKDIGTEGCSANISACCLGNAYSYKGFRYCYLGDKLHDNTYMKPVLQYTESGCFIKEFANTKHVEAETGIKQASINACCNGANKTSHGFVWKYKTSDVYPLKINPVIKNKYSVPVNKYDLNDNFIEGYESINIAAEKNKVTKASITRGCQGKIKNPRKYIWRYAS